MRYQRWGLTNGELTPLGGDTNKRLHPWISLGSANGHEIIGIACQEPIPDMDGYPDALMQISEEGRHIVFGWRGDPGMAFVIDGMRPTEHEYLVIVIETPEWLEKAHYANPGDLGDLLKMLCDFLTSSK